MGVSAGEKGGNVDRIKTGRHDQKILCSIRGCMEHKRRRSFSLSHRHVSINNNEFLSLNIHYAGYASQRAKREISSCR